MYSEHKFFEKRLIFLLTYPFNKKFENYNSALVNLTFYFGQIKENSHKKIIMMFKLHK
jgi:hypothetical protein